MQKQNQQRWTTTEICSEVDGSKCLFIVIIGVSLEKSVIELSVCKRVCLSVCVCVCVFVYVCVWEKEREIERELWRIPALNILSIFSYEITCSDSLLSLVFTV